MRKRQTTVLFGLIPALLIAGAVLLLGLAKKPPRFTARAAFAVDWNSMPSVPNDKQADKVRTAWRHRIVTEVLQLPNSEGAIVDILERADALSNNQDKNGAVIAELKRGLRVKLLNQTAGCDQFSVEVQNNDTNFARAGAQGILQGTMARLKDEAKTAGGLAALRSSANVQDVIRHKDDLKTERRKLQEAGSLLSRERASQRLQEIDAELFALELDHAVAGLGFLGNLFGVVSTEGVKVIEKVQVEKRGAGYEISILFIAVILGCSTGAAGLLTHRLLQTELATNKTSSDVPPPALTTDKASD